MARPPKIPNEISIEISKQAHRKAPLGRPRKSSSSPKAAAKKTDPLATALGLLTRASGSPLVEKLNLGKPLERAVSAGSRTTFSAMKTANAAFQPIRKLNSAASKQTQKNSALFDLSLTDEQAMFKDTVARFAEHVLRPAAEQADEKNSTPQVIRQQAHELGIHLASVPESLGGVGDWSPTTGAIIAEALAHGDMAMALAILSPIGVINSLVAWGTTEQQTHYLQPLLAEHTVAASTAVLEPQPLFNPLALSTTATATNDGYTLNGVKSLVPLAKEAELLLVAAELSGVGPQLFLVESGAAGVSITEEPAMGLRAAGLGKIELKNVTVQRSALLGNGNFSYQEFLSRQLIGASALAVGNSQAVLDYVVPYIKERRAFGEPIAQRQSVAFMAANIAIELEGMRLLTWRTAAKAGQQQAFQQDAYLAQLQCAEKGMEIASNGVQLLGGHGFVKEHPAERWYRHARGSSLLSSGFVV